RLEDNGHLIPAERTELGRRELEHVNSTGAIVIEIHLVALAHQALEDRTRRAFIFVGGRIVDHLAIGDDGWWAQQARDSVGKRRLAASTFSCQAKYFAPSQSEAHVSDSMDRAIAR